MYIYNKLWNLKSIVLSMFLITSFALAGCGGDGGEGPEPESSASIIKRSKDTAYAIVAEVLYADKTLYATTGTAFAIGNRLLATNAHVTKAFCHDSSVFPDGYIIKNVFAVQSGTGETFTLTRALTHPKYDGNPFESPDVGLFTTMKDVPQSLQLASSSEVEGLYDSGELESAELILSGFPGDVQELFQIEPGETIPQATTLTGTVATLRNFDTSVTVVGNTIDIIQHQIPTTPGTSGSALVLASNGKVVAAHNAGTVEIVIKLDNNGQPYADRVSAASNNFGIHVKHLHDLIAGFDSNSIQGFELPAKGTEYTGRYIGELSGGRNKFTFTIDAKNKLYGVSYWENYDFMLLGAVTEPVLGKVVFFDNDVDEQAMYIGYIRSQSGVEDGEFYVKNESGEFILQPSTWNVLRE